VIIATVVQQGKVVVVEGPWLNAEIFSYHPDTLIDCDFDNALDALDVVSLETNGRGDSQ